MKPETKRTATVRRRTKDDEGGSSAFNLVSLKHAIEAIDHTSKENSINLSSLSAALSAASREMKQREKSQRKQASGNCKKKKTNKERKNKKLVIGTKPATHAELLRWFANFDKSFVRSLPIKLKPSLPKTILEPEICEFNTDFRMNHSFESFRF